MVFERPIAKQLPTATQSPDIAELIALCIANDRVAQATLYKTYHGKLLSMCLRYFTNRDDALEALNHGFLKVFKNLEQYNPSLSFEGWIYRIVQRTALDYFRSKFRKETEHSLELIETDAMVPAEVESNLGARDLMQLLHQLPPTSRAVFNLFAIEGYQHQEIAELMQISVGTSKWHVNKAREILRALILNTEAHGK